MLKIKEIIKNRVIINLASVFGGQIYLLLINLLTFIIAARYLSVEEFGSFGFLLATVAILAKFVDLGMNPILFKRNSSNKNTATEIGNVFLFRILVLITIILMTNIFMLLYNINRIDFLLTNLLLLNILLSSKYVPFRDLLAIPFKADLKVHIPVFLSILDNTLFFLLVIIMPIFNGGIVYLVFAYVFSNIPGMLILIFLFKKHYRFGFKFNFQEVYTILKKSYSLAIFVLLSYTFVQLDIIMVKYFRGDYETGLFSAAVRVVRPLVVIPLAVVTTFFPLLLNSNVILNERKNIISILLKILIILPIIFATVYGFKSTEIFTLIFGIKYVQADNISTVLFMDLIFYFVNFTLVDFFIIYNKQAIAAIYSIIVVVLYIFIGVIIVPIWGMYSAAILKVVVGFIGSFYLFKIGFENNIIDKVLIPRDIFVLVVFVLSHYLISCFEIFEYLLSSSFLILMLLLSNIVSYNEVKVLLKLKSKSEH